MTFETRLAGSRKHISLWLTIQGVEEIFKETSGVGASTYLGESRTEITGLFDVEEGMQEIDYTSRSVKGGGLTFKIPRQRDGSIDYLFNARARQHSYIAAPMTKTQTSMTVLDNTLFSSGGGTIFIGGETITYTGVSGADTLTGLTRGKYASLAQKHKQTTESPNSWGAGVYLSPPTFFGRRVTLYASFLNDQGEDVATQIMGTFSIEQSPEFDSLAWSFSCAPLVDEIADRLCYKGLKDTKIASWEGGASDGYIDVVFSDDVAFAAVTPFVSSVLVKGDSSGVDAPAFYVVIDEAGTTKTVVDDQIFSYLPATPAGTRYLNEARHVCALTGNGRASILSAVCSVLGDNANGDYDILPGYESDDIFVDSWNFGAAVPEAYVDIASFESPELFSRGWVYLLAKQVSLADLLSSFCWVHDLFWYTTREGKLSVKRISDTFVKSTSIVDDISSVNIIAGSPSVSFDDSRLFPTAKISVNYDPDVDKFAASVNVRDQELSSRYQNRTSPLSMDVFGVYVDTSQSTAPSGRRLIVPGMMQLPEFETTVRRWMLGGTGGRGDTVVNVSCTLDMMNLSVGDIVNIDISEMPNLEGSSFYGFSPINGTAEVISRRPRWKSGTVDLSVRMRNRVFAIAPFFQAETRTTTNVANDTLNSSVTSPGEGGSSNFFVGQQVAIWQGMSFSYTAPQILTITAIPSSSSIVFSAAVTPFTAGETWVTWDNVGSAEGTTTASGVEEDDLAFNVTGPQPGTIAEGEVRRWQ